MPTAHYVYSLSPPHIKGSLYTIYMFVRVYSKLTSCSFNGRLQRTCLLTIQLYFSWITCLYDYKKTFVSVPENTYFRQVFCGIFWSLVPSYMYKEHEGNTEEENNGYVVFNRNIHGSVGKEQRVLNDVWSTRLSRRSMIWLLPHPHPSRQ